MFQNKFNMIKNSSIALILMILTALMIPSSVYAQEPGNSQEVLVPVILDGTLYQPAEFNSMHQELRSNGKNLIFLVKGEKVEAFSSLEKLQKVYSLQIDLSTIDEQEPGISMTRSIDPGYAYNWVDINRGGACSAIQEGWQGNLDSQWRNVISSVWYEADEESWYNIYFLCEDLNYGGDWHGFLEGSGSDNLNDLGFNDDAESVFFGQIS